MSNTQERINQNLNDLEQCNGHVKQKERELFEARALREEVRSNLRWLRTLVGE